MKNVNQHKIEVMKSLKWGLVDFDMENLELKKPNQDLNWFKRKIKDTFFAIIFYFRDFSDPFWDLNLVFSRLDVKFKSLSTTCGLYPTDITVSNSFPSENLKWIKMNGKLQYFHYNFFAVYNWHLISSPLFLKFNSLSSTCCLK